MMKYNKLALVIGICSVLSLTACKKAEEPKAHIKTDQTETSAPISAEKISSERDLMLQAIHHNENKLQEDNCAIDEVDDPEKRLVTGDLNQDGQIDFIYDYSVVSHCGAQATSHMLGIFLKSGSDYVLDSVYPAGLNELNRLNLHDIDAKGQLNVDLDEVKTKMVYKNKDLIQIVDPNKKVIIPIGKDSTIQNSILAKDIESNLYIPEEIECGGFFPDDYNEKRTSIDRYDLSIANDRVAIVGVYGLTAQDQVLVDGKTLDFNMGVQQIQKLFAQNYEQQLTKNQSEKIGSAGPKASQLKYDVMLSVRRKDLDDAFLLYFNQHKLIAVQYFVPC